MLSRVHAPNTSLSGIDDSEVMALALLVQQALGRARASRAARGFAAGSGSPWAPSEPAASGR